MLGVRHTTDGIAVLDLPEPEGEGVIVESTVAGICGSDLHVMEVIGPRPVTMGHEIGGLLDGRPVAVQPFPFCGECVNCELGNSHLCRCNSALYGQQVDGGMAERVLVDPRCVVELPADIDPAVTCLVEPLAVGVHAVHLAQLAPGMKVAVIGAGAIGLVTGAFAGLEGVEIDIAARHAVQAEAAEKLGLNIGLSGKYDVVFDAAATESSIAQALDVVRPAGTVVLPGIFWGEFTMPGFPLSLKEIRIVPSMYYGHHHGEREMDIAGAALGRLPALPDAVITHRFPLDRAAEAFEVAADRAAGAIKVVIEP